MAMAVARLPPILVSLAREGRDAQHINAIPKSSQRDKYLKNPPAAGADLP
jgi:hypothetical protein